MDSPIEPEADRADIRQRKVDAPCDVVYRAFSDPDQLAAWWGPDGFTNTINEFDLREGGYWRFIMHGPDGKDFQNEIRFVEIVPNRCVVLEHFSGHHFFLTITFSANEEATTVGWRQVFDTVAHYRKIAEFVATANEQNLDRLAAAVGESTSGTAE